MLRTANIHLHSSSPQGANSDAFSGDSASDLAHVQLVGNPVEPGNLIAKVARLATLPQIADRILKLPLEGDADKAEFVKILQDDPALTASILRRVNSPYFGMTHRINHLARAATLLGARELKNVALTVIVKRMFDGPATCGTYTREALWRHCLAVAVSARKIARVTGAVPQHEAYLAGLLHHLGTLLIDLHLRTTFRSMIQRLDGSRPTSHQEREMLSFDQAQLGAHTARSWGLPASITDAIGYHEAPGEYAGEHEELVRLLSVADYLCSRAGLTALGIFNTTPPSGRAYAVLGLDRVALVIIWDDLLTHLADATNF